MCPSITRPLCITTNFLRHISHDAQTWAQDHPIRFSLKAGPIQPRTCACVVTSQRRRRSSAISSSRLRPCHAIIHVAQSRPTSRRIAAPRPQRIANPTFSNCCKTARLRAAPACCGATQHLGDLVANAFARATRTASVPEISSKMRHLDARIFFSGSANKSPGLRSVKAIDPPRIALHPQQTQQQTARQRLPDRFRRPERKVSPAFSPKLTPSTDNGAAPKSRSTDHLLQKGGPMSSSRQSEYIPIE